MRVSKFQVLSLKIDADSMSSGPQLTFKDVDEDIDRDPDDWTDVLNIIVSLIKAKCSQNHIFHMLGLLLNDH